jgi:8-oxo-dGTP pyrophosphatase MutT (NUDIX family)
MNNLLPGIRNAVRAVILRDEQLLLLRKNGNGGGLRFALPGGAQDLGETLEQALQRECEEEIGTPVQLVELLHVADYFKPRATEPPSTRHLVEFLFLCRVPDDYRPRSGHHPDKHQIGVEWVALQELSAVNLLPSGVRKRLAAAATASAPVYLGKIE